jgi:3-isopropylmalate/(R)-2-methylmalate dehydratase small subunit
LKESEKINEGDELEVDLVKGEVRNLTQGTAYHSQPFAEFMGELIASGGLMRWIRKERSRI